MGKLNFRRWRMPWIHPQIVSAFWMLIYLISLLGLLYVFYPRSPAGV